MAGYESMMIVGFGTDSYSDANMFQIVYQQGHFITKTLPSMHAREMLIC